jgi:hypothetical protein
LHRWTTLLSSLIAKPAGEIPIRGWYHELSSLSVAQTVDSGQCQCQCQWETRREAECEECSDACHPANGERRTLNSEINRLHPESSETEYEFDFGRVRLGEREGSGTDEKRALERRRTLNVQVYRTGMTNSMVPAPSFNSWRVTPTSVALRK